MPSEKTKGFSLADQLRFLRGLAARPRMIGAIAPSGPTLARMMASHVDPGEDLPVIELGPGTGVVTKALLERGVSPSRLIAIEYNPDFCRLLSERFPGITVLQGDAYDLAGTLPKGRSDRVAAIVSSLPLVSRPPEDHARLIEAALDRMAPGRPYIQFSYMPHPPAEPVPGRFSAEASHWIWLNLPPARVWLYRRPAG